MSGINPKTAELVRDCLSAKHMPLVNMSMGYEVSVGRTETYKNDTASLAHGDKWSTRDSQVCFPSHFAVLFVGVEVLVADGRLLILFKVCTTHFQLVERMWVLIWDGDSTLWTFYPVPLARRSERAQPIEASIASHRALHQSHKQCCASVCFGLNWGHCQAVVLTSPERNQPALRGRDHVDGR